MRNPFRKDPDPFAPKTYGEIFRSVRTRERRHMRHKWQWITLAVFLTIAVVAGYGAYYFYSVQGDLQDRVGGVTKRGENEPFNALLVGSDSREGLTEQEQHDLGARAVGGQRADTIILVHIDPRTDHVVLVQFPRDLYVPIAGGGEDKINAALNSGPGKLVQTVRDLTGLTINHYVQLNIAGFRDLVDAIGGVEICVPEPIPFDRQTGLEIKPEEVGMVEFDGDRALRFVRSRAFPSGDFDRIRNQQRFLAAAVNKVLSASSLFQPGRVKGLIDVARGNLTIDQNTTVRGLIDLAGQLRSFEPQRYEAYTVPNRGITQSPAGASVVEPDLEAMEVMFDAIARNRSPAEADGVPNIDPAIIRVGVYNGNSLEQPYASRAAQALREATDTGSGPVDIVEVANANRFGFERTVVRYDPDSGRPETERMAELVAAAIPGAKLTTGPTADGVDVAVIVGQQEFTTRKLVQLNPIPIPPPGEVPPECRA